MAAEHAIKKQSQDTKNKRCHTILTNLKGDILTNGIKRRKDFPKQVTQLAKFIYRICRLT